MKVARNLAKNEHPGLKSCPFCLGEGKMECWLEDSPCKMYNCFCSKCEAKSRYSKAKHYAAKIWNTRVGEKGIV